MKDKVHIPKPVRFLLTAAFLPFLLASCALNLSAIRAEMPDLSGKADGTYRGEYDLPKAPVRVTLDVRIQDARITGIDVVKHICSPIGKKAEKITDQIIAKQSLDVDAVTGATGSSKAILKAVEDALKEEGASG
ncbi:MAG: FMN-binding protein [Treponema sp.]|jgi:uncharacterized protein with FMN-binding domain|nr:FMN-binding protein [Treponema sp.]